MLGQSVNLVGTRDEVRKSYSHLSHLSFTVLIVLRKGKAGMPPFCYKPAISVPQKKTKELLMYSQADQSSLNVAP